MNMESEDISFLPRDNMSNFQLPLSALCFVLEDILKKWKRIWYVGVFTNIK